MPSFTPRKAPALRPKKSRPREAAQRSVGLVLPRSFVESIFYSPGGAFGKVVLALLVLEQEEAAEPGAPFRTTIAEIRSLTSLGNTAAQEAVQQIREAGLIDYTPGHGTWSTYRILRPGSAPAPRVESSSKAAASGKASRSRSLAPLTSCLKRLLPGISTEERAEMIKAFGKPGQAAAAAAALEEINQTDEFALGLPNELLIPRVKQQIASQQAAKKK